MLSGLCLVELEVIIHFIVHEETHATAICTDHICFRGRSEDSCAIDILIKLFLCFSGRSEENHAKHTGVLNFSLFVSGANLLQLIRLTSDGQIADNIKMSTSSHDVTGGMRTKLRSAKDIVASSSGQTRVFVAKIGSRDAQKLCLDQSINIKDCEATEVVIDTSS